MKPSEVDVLHLFAAYAGTRRSMAMLPEMLRVLGEDAFAIFQAAFGGRTLSVPSHGSVVELMRHVRIWLFVLRRTEVGVSKVAACEEAASYFRCSRKTVRTVESQVGKLAKRLYGS